MSYYLERRQLGRIRRLGDVLLAAMLLLVNVTVSDSCRAGNQVGEPGTRFRRANVHWVRRAPFSDAEISDRDLRSRTSYTTMGSDADPGGSIAAADANRVASTAYQRSPRRDEYSRQRRTVAIVSRLKQFVSILPAPPGASSRLHCA
jgi:hypothetical protein